LTKLMSNTVYTETPEVETRPRSKHVKYKPHTMHITHVSQKPQSKATATYRPLSELEYRDIARMFVKALPLDGDDYLETIEAYIQIIRKLSSEAKIALRCAYIFSAKVPYDDREDFFQDLALTLLKAKHGEEKLAYAVARCDWIDFWKRQHTHDTKFCVYASDRGIENPECKDCTHKAGKHCAWLAYRGIRSLDSEITDNDGNNTSLSELIVGEADYEAKLDSKLDVQTIEAKLKAFPSIWALIEKRLIGNTLTKIETDTLDRWVNKTGYSLLLN